MHIIAIAWIYVVSMMALTETSFIAGLMTFIFYCVVPLGLIGYFMKRRKHRMASMHHARHAYELKLQQTHSSKSEDKLEPQTENND